MLPRLVKGRALWMVAGRHAVVHHVVGRRYEFQLTDTDEAMSACPARPLIDRDDLLRRVDLDALLEALSGCRVGGRWHCPDAGHPDEHPSVTVQVGADGVGRGGAGPVGITARRSTP